MEVRICAFLLWSLLLTAGIWETQYYYGIKVLSDLSSQAALVPGLVAYFIWNERKRIFLTPSFSIARGAQLGGAAIVSLVLAIYSMHRGAREIGAMLLFLSAITFVIAGFVAMFGRKALRSAVFPLAMLLLMVPLPSIVADKTISLLQIQSAWLSSILLSATGTPVYREGILIFIPGATIEVAKECSGINSSVALLVTMLIIAYRTLHTNWRRAVLLVLSIPFSIIKNSVRIATLTLLATRVDPGFLTGRLHHEGGFVFYLLTLLLMYPLWRLLEKGDRKVPSETRAVMPDPPALSASSGVSS
jgi:exosortase